EDLQQVPIADLLWVERDLHHLRVPGRPGAHLLVRGVWHVAAGVTRLHVLHTPQQLEDRLQAPEAAAGECRDFRAFRLAPPAPAHLTPPAPRWRSRSAAARRTPPAPPAAPAAATPPRAA